MAMGSMDAIPERERQPGRHRGNTTNRADATGLDGARADVPAERTRHTRPLVGPTDEPAGEPRHTLHARSRPATANPTAGITAAHNDVVGGIPWSPAPPPANPRTDTGPVGLRMFNLGTIPASVTPPRSWRRAAWFTIAASAAALIGLLALGEVLVCPMRGVNRISAMPFPSGAPLPALDGSILNQPANGHPRTGRPSPPYTGVDRVTNVGDMTSMIPRHTTTAVRGVSADDTPRSVVDTLPTETTSIVSSASAVDPSQLLQRTETFFASVTSNVPAAVGLTAIAEPDDAIGLINRTYGDLSSIEVQSITPNSANGTTVSALRLVYKDGTTTDQQTTLYFTATDDPKIVNPGG